MSGPVNAIGRLFQPITSALGRAFTPPGSGGSAPGVPNITIPAAPPTAPPAQTPGAKPSANKGAQNQYSMLTAASKAAAAAGGGGGATTGKSLLGQ